MFSRREIQRYIKKKLKKECPICYVFITPLVKLCQRSQGHWLCETCFEKTCETSQKCAFCSEDIASNPIRNRGLEKVIQNVKTKECAASLS